MQPKVKIVSSILMVCAWAVVSLLTALLTPSDVEEARFTIIVIFWALFSVGTLLSLLAIAKSNSQN